MARESQANLSCQHIYIYIYMCVCVSVCVCVCVRTCVKWRKVFYHLIHFAIIQELMKVFFSYFLLGKYDSELTLSLFIKWNWQIKKSNLSLSFLSIKNNQLLEN